jgi:hypothetical protein
MRVLASSSFNRLTTAEIAVRSEALKREAEAAEQT